MAFLDFKATVHALICIITISGQEACPANPMAKIYYLTRKKAKFWSNTVMCLFLLEVISVIA